MTMEHIKRRFEVTLWITHAPIDPEAISRELELQPFKQSKAGQPRVTPTGSALGGTYESSSWGHIFDVRGYSELGECITWILDRVSAHGTFLQRLVRGGASVELFCGVFAGGNWDESLDHALLGRLAGMGIDLRLDVYPNQDTKPV